MDTQTQPNVRAERLRLLALSPSTVLEAFLDQLNERHPLPTWTLVRGPECGLVMVRGRVGGQGAPFNAGEALVTRACVKMDAGLGCGYVLGEEPRHAELIAVLDALWQKEEFARLLDAELVPDLVARLQARYEDDRSRSAATKVDFFTMVRGEDKD